MARRVWPIADEKICLHAVLDDGRLAAQGLVSTRSLGVAAALAGLPVGEIPDLVRRFFSLCGAAHAVAALTAIEAALGVALSPAQHAFRELMLLVEHANALAWRTLMDWPPFVGGSADVRAYADVLRAGAPIAAAAARAQQIGGAALRPRREDLARAALALATRLAALFPEAADPALSFPALQVGIARGDSLPARLIRQARVRVPADYGRHQLPLFAGADADWFAARLIEAPCFSDAPSLDGVPAEVGPLAARRHPLVAEALAQWGPGLATRLLAAALDLTVVAERLRGACEGLAEDDPVAVDTVRTGRGAGVVETARGPLAYCVEADGGRVRILRSVAPTEWNFHPQGPFLAALRSAPRVADPVAAAHLLAASFDPCVPFEVTPAPVWRAPREDLLHA